MVLRRSAMGPNAFQVSNQTTGRTSNHAYARAASAMQSNVAPDATCVLMRQVFELAHPFSAWGLPARRGVRLMLGHRQSPSNQT